MAKKKIAFIEKNQRTLSFCKNTYFFFNINTFKGRCLIEVVYII